MVVQQEAPAPSVFGREHFGPSFGRGLVTGAFAA